MGRILIIDDDQALRGTMRKILERAGHEVREAADGVEGLKLFREDPPDLVVTDLVMPRKEGIETIMEIRAASEHVRILAVSGADAGVPAGRLFDAEALGANASLPKPFTVDQLTSVVAALLA